MNAPVRRMTVGDRVPNFLLPDHGGRRRELYNSDLDGGPILLLFLGGDAGPAERALAALAAATGADVPVLADADGAVTGGFASAAGVRLPAAFALDPNQRIVAILPAGDAGWAANAAAVLAPFAAGGEARTVTAQAPVLLVPRVLDDGCCGRLMEAWAAGERDRNVVHHASGDGYGDATMAEVKRREDFIVPSGSPLERELAVTLLPRLAPEVERAFAFDREWGFEPFRIGRYGAEDAGFFRPHRDNPSADLRHRQFAVTINLNTGDYEGGDLRFPEYGPERYAPPRGGAVVFACGLLHEVVPVTKGARFTLLTFILTRKQPAA